MTPKVSTAARRLMRSLGMLLVVFLYGTLGHWLFLRETVTLTEAAFRTTLMLATINEAFPAPEVATDLQPAFKVFMLTLVLFGVAVILYSLSTITAFFVEGELQELLRRRKMSKEIARFKNHFIVCGGGDTGLQIAYELRESRYAFVVVESNPERVEKLQHDGHPYIMGDALEDEILLEAGVERAKGIAVALPSDKENLFVTLSARQLNPTLRIIAKGSDHSTDRKLKKAGADTVVSPAVLGGMRIASELVRPMATRFIDKMLRDPTETTRIEEIVIYEGSELSGKTIVSSKFRQRTGLQIVALLEPDSETYCYQPDVDKPLAPGTTLVVIGPVRMVAEARHLAGMD
ncbi:MAG: NAD-binding protein [Pseudomonadota bacterium]